MPRMHPISLPCQTPLVGYRPSDGGHRRPRLRAAIVAVLVGVWCAPALAIDVGTPTTSFASVGNGVQVTADWVFTAQHAVLNPGDTFSNGFGNRTVAARYDALGSGAFPANDFALMRLVPLATAAPSLAVLGTAFADGPLGPLNVTIASAANAGPARAYGFTTVGEAALQYDPDDAGPLGPVTVNWLISLDTGVHVESGDSGGGLFFGHVFDTGLLLGISSALITDDLDQPLGSAFVQPAAYRPWIDQVMAADSADDQAVLWVSAVPEPATWALWTGGALLGLGLRQRRAAQMARQVARQALGQACKARKAGAAASVAS